LVIADAGHPLPPTGFVADLGHLALGKDRDGRRQKDQISVPDWPPQLARTYDDHVLGKLYADWTFERAGDALKRIEAAKQPLGLAYMVRQIRERAGLGGVELSPGVIRGLLTNAKPEENLRRGWELLNQQGPLPLLVELYEQIVGAARRTAEFLALEDIIALEQQSALLTMGEYVAHRQVLQMAARFEEGLPRHQVRPMSGRKEVPTRVLDEDVYPVGGFSSISTRGSIESLLHSQLAYMEKEKDRRPDLFDVKFLRDELYYYSRDENQFLRRRRVFVFVLRPDLALARFKDAELPCQRLVLVLALMLAAVRKLSEWLSADALRFEFLIVDNGKHPLAEEAKLLALLFREQIANGTVGIESIAAGEVEKRLVQWARRNQCHCLQASVAGAAIDVAEAAIADLRINAAVPDVRLENAGSLALEAEEPLDAWIEILLRLLQQWI
jgi:hypothetical protein